MKSKKVFVLGMAKSGYEAAKFLANKGYKVVVNDLKFDQNEGHVEELRSLGVQVVLGRHPDDLFNDSFEMVVKNPGIMNNHKYVKKAQELNIPVINELELGFSYFPAGVTVIGITGTNGKTTTTTLVYEILKKTTDRVFLMGNIGYPVCSFADKLHVNDVAVIEVSDHQLCNVKEFKTNISVLTNLSKAHLDFHGSYDNYMNVKRRIFNHHTNKDIAILNIDNTDVLNCTIAIKSTIKYFTAGSYNGSGCYIANDYIYYKDDKIIALNEIMIKGKHNYENAMAAIMVVKELGVNNNAIVSVLKSFGGVEHRIEYVKNLNNIDFYNDSKATNIKSTQTALASFTKPTIILLGGLDRGHSFAGLKEYMENVKVIVAFGEVRNRINDFAVENSISCKVVESLKEATEVAYRSANEGDVVLLSPACASWDRYKSYEERGELFKEYVKGLPSIDCRSHN